MGVGFVKFLPPKAPILTKWIKGYYIHRSEDPEFDSKVTFYQNITTTISIYNDSVVQSEGRLRRQLFSEGAGYRAVLVGQVDNYQEVEFLGPVDRIAIVFHPGGLNQFLNKPLGDLLAKHFSLVSLSEFGLEEITPSVFAAKTIESKRAILDDFFIRKFHPFEQLELLKAIEVLTTADPLPRVKDLAENLGISRRTLLRKFKKHLGYSIQEYISVIKFRKALLNFQKSRSLLNLTDLALDSQYYDQADFNHQMKDRSGLTPRELFAQLSIQDGTLFWKT